MKLCRELMDREIKVPSEWVSQFAQTTAIANSVWEEAKAKNDFALFQPHLEKIVEMRRQYADLFFKPYDHVYDPLLHHFDRGLSTPADLVEIFSALRPRQVELIRQISSRPQVDDRFLHGKFPEKDQWDFGVEVISAFGYDWNRGDWIKPCIPSPLVSTWAMSASPHGFMKTWLAPLSSPACTRLATRSIPWELPRLGRTPLSSNHSMALHESQSRMWENLVGRSKPFWNITSRNSNPAFNHNWPM